MDLEDTLLLFFPIMATYFGKLGCLQNEEPYLTGATGAGMKRGTFEDFRLKTRMFETLQWGGG